MVDCGKDFDHRALETNVRKKRTKSRSRTPQMQERTLFAYILIALMVTAITLAVVYYKRKSEDERRIRRGGQPRRSRR